MREASGLQIVLFRPSHRERQEWVEQLRQAGHTVRLVHDAERVGAAEFLIVDSSVERWKEYVRWLEGHAAPVLLLSEEKAMKSEVAGITGVITPFDLPEVWPRTSAIQLIEKTGELERPESKIGTAEQHHDRREMESQANLKTVSSTSLEPESPAKGKSLIPLSKRKTRRVEGAAAPKEQAAERNGINQQATESASDALKEDNPGQGESDGAVEGDWPARSDSDIQQAKVFAVYAAKGGVGKSTFLLHLAARLANQGKRVCVVDLDWLHGTVTTHLQLPSRTTLSDIIRHVETGTTKRSLMPTEWQFSIVTALRESDEPSPDLDVIKHLIAGLRNEADIVLIDTAKQWNSELSAVLQEVDQLWLMTTDEHPSVQNLVRMAKHINQLESGPDISIIWNRLEEPVVGDLRNLFPWPTVLDLPESSTVKKAIRAGTLSVDPGRDAYVRCIDQWLKKWEPAMISP